MRVAITGPRRSEHMKAKKTRNAKKATVAVALAVATLGAYFAFFHGDPVESRIQRLADQTNKLLPIQVDSDIRFDRVEAGPGRKCSFIYTVRRVPRNDLSDEDMQSYKDYVIRNALADHTSQALLADGVTFWFRYFDTSGKQVCEFSVKN
jgi:hypothetical protein